MSTTLTQTMTNRPRRWDRLVLLIALVLFLATLVLVFILQSKTAPLSTESIEAAIEDKHGIHITMVAVTAAGGVVDFRFRVTDPEKAEKYMHGPYSELPILIAETNGTRIDPRTHIHKVNYEFGRTYYMIYRNPGGVIEPGSEVTVVLGDLRLNDVPVR